MNKPITLKITLALFFVSICQLTLMAQDTTKKSNPAQTNVPASSNPLSSAYQNQSNNIVPMPVRTSPMDHPVVKMTSLPTKPTVITPNIPAKVTPSVSPAMAPKVSPSINAANTAGASTPANSAPAKPAVTPIHTTQSGYTAPTTAERSVTPTLIPRKVTPIMVPVKVPPTQVSNTTPPPPSNSTPPPATTTTTVAPVTLPVMTSPSNTDSIAAKKDTSAKKDSLIAKKDTTKKDSLLAKTDTTKKDTSNADSIGFQKQRIVFAEIGGPGLAISANYDMRVQIGSSNKLFGFRAGFGYFQSGNNWVFTVPLQANYLLGKDGKYFEFGLGTTFLVSRGDNYSSKNFIFDNDTGFIATGTIGIRYAPANSHVNFRLAYVPILDSDGLVNIGGFSVGYTF